MKLPKRAFILLLWTVTVFFAVCGCSAVQSQSLPEKVLPPVEKTVTLTFSYGSNAFTKTIPYGGSVEVQAPPPENGKVFAGWFCGNDKLTGNAQFTSDKNFVAVFIGRGDYKGVFRSAELLTVNFSETEGVGIDNDFYPEAQLKLTESGELTLLYSGGEWTFFMVDGLLTGTHERASKKTSYAFMPITHSAEYAGAYRTADGESFVLGEYGTVLSCLGEVSGGVYTVADGSLTVTFRRNRFDDTFTTMRFQADGYGNFTRFFNGNTELYVLSEGVTSFCAENGDKLTVFLRGSEYVYTLCRQSTQIVKAEGEPKEGNVLVLSGAVNTAVKLLEDNRFVYASAERGTYVSTTGDRLVLDGFGKASIRGFEWAYEVAGTNIIAFGEGNLTDYIRLKEDGKYERIDFNVHAFAGRWTGKEEGNSLTVNAEGFTVFYRGVTANFKVDPSDGALIFTAFEKVCRLKLDGGVLSLSYSDDLGETVREQYGTDGTEGRYLGPSNMLTLDGLGFADFDGEELTYKTDENAIVFSNGMTGEINGESIILTLPDGWVAILNKA